MANKTKKSGEKKAKVVSIRLTQDETRRLQEILAQKRYTTSTLLRHMLFNLPIIARDNEAAIAKIVQIGAMLKMIDLDSKGLYSDQTASIFRELEEAIKRIAAKVEPA